jgi:DNA-binding CsgD family transcriptional regulator
VSFARNPLTRPRRTNPGTLTPLPHADGYGKRRDRAATAGPAAAKPVGRVRIKAYWLGATDGPEQTRRIGITIERRVPRALALRRKVESLPLTARDLSGPHLADGMGLAPSTVTTHQRSIYAKLGVHSRAELFRALELA